MKDKLHILIQDKAEMTATDKFASKFNRRSLYDSLCPWFIEKRRIQRFQKHAEKIAAKLNFEAIDKKSEALGKASRIQEIAILDDEIIRLDNRIDEVEILIREREDVDDQDQKETFGEGVKKFLQSFFNSNVSEEEIRSQREKLIQQAEIGELVLSLNHIHLEDIIYAVRDSLIDRRDRFTVIKIKVENDLSRVKVTLDFRHRIRHFIDKMYRYNNSDDDEGIIYKTKTSQRSFIMNNLLNLFRHGIQNTNVGVFRLHPNNTRMGSRAA